MSRANDKTPKSALALLVLLAASACGIGTEIGNGAKPDDKGKGGGGDPTPAADGQTSSSSSPDMVTPAPGKDEKNKTAADGANDKAAGGDGAVPAAAAAAPGNALLAPCGTPFATAYASPLKLVQRDAAGKEVMHLDATYTASTKTWTVRPSDGTPVMDVTALPSSATGAASVRNTPAGTLTPTDAYACTKYTTTLNATVPGGTTLATQVSVVLTPVATPAAPITVLWYIQPGAGTPDRLLRVDLQTSGTTQTLLNEP